MDKEDIEHGFPNLAKVGYSITSPKTPDYNCIAWAAEDDETWWWPSRIPRQATLATFIQAYGTLGYVVCDNANYEPDIQKIAIYVDSNKIPTHAARQLPDGKWTSKLGKNEDITHNSLEGLEHWEYGYGNVAIIMKRPFNNRGE